MTDEFWNDPIFLQLVEALSTDPNTVSTPPRPGRQAQSHLASANPPPESVPFAQDQGVAIVQPPPPPPPQPQQIGSLFSVPSALHSTHIELEELSDFVSGAPHDTYQIETEGALFASREPRASSGSRSHLGSLISRKSPSKGSSRDGYGVLKNVPNLGDPGFDGSWDQFFLSSAGDDQLLDETTQVQRNPHEFDEEITGEGLCGKDQHPPLVPPLMPALITNNSQPLPQEQLPQQAQYHHQQLQLQDSRYHHHTHQHYHYQSQQQNPSLSSRFFYGENDLQNFPSLAMEERTIGQGQYDMIQGAARLVDGVSDLWEAHNWPNNPTAPHNHTGTCQHGHGVDGEGDNHDFHSTTPSPETLRTSPVYSPYPNHLSLQPTGTTATHKILRTLQGYIPNERTLTELTRSAAIRQACRRCHNALSLNAFPMRVTPNNSILFFDSCAKCCKTSPVPICSPGFEIPNYQRLDFKIAYGWLDMLARIKKRVVDPDLTYLEVWTLAEDVYGDQNIHTLRPKAPYWAPNDLPHGFLPIFEVHGLPVYLRTRGNYGIEGTKETLSKSIPADILPSVKIHDDVGDHSWAQSEISEPPTDEEKELLRRLLEKTIKEPVEKETGLVFTPTTQESTRENRFTIRWNCSRQDDRKWDSINSRRLLSGCIGLINVTYYKGKRALLRVEFVHGHGLHEDGSASKEIVD